MLANTVPVILQDETFVRQLVQQDRTIAERIVEFLQDFLNTLKTIYEQLIAESSWTQMELLRKDMETVGLIADLFNAALEDADGNVVREGATVKYAKRDAGNGRMYVEADREAIFGDDPSKWASQITNYINREIRKGKDVTVYGADGDLLTITRDTAGKARFRNEVREKMEEQEK